MGCGVVRHVLLRELGLEALGLHLRDGAERGRQGTAEGRSGPAAPFSGGASGPRWLLGHIFYRCIQAHCSPLFAWLWEPGTRSRSQSPALQSSFPTHLSHNTLTSCAWLPRLERFVQRQARCVGMCSQPARARIINTHFAALIWAPFKLKAACCSVPACLAAGKRVSLASQTGSSTCSGRHHVLTSREEPCLGLPAQNEEADEDSLLQSLWRQGGCSCPPGKKGEAGDSFTCTQEICVAFRLGSSLGPCDGEFPNWKTCPSE